MILKDSGLANVKWWNFFSRTVLPVLNAGSQNYWCHTLKSKNLKELTFTVRLTENQLVLLVLGDLHLIHRGSGLIDSIRNQ